jgi:hypothetical protein
MAFDLTKITDDTLREELKKELEALEKHEGFMSQSDFDRKVNELSQKYIKDEKELETKIRKQIEDDAKLSAEENAKKILEEAEAKQKEVLKKENRLEALTKCTAAGIPKDTVDKMLKYLVTDDATETIKNVDEYVEEYKKLQGTIKEELMKGVPDPNKGGDPNTVTAEDFKKMPYAKQVEFKEKNPDKAAEFLKS